MGSNHDFEQVTGHHSRLNVCLGEIRSDHILRTTGQFKKIFPLNIENFPVPLGLPCQENSYGSHHRTANAGLFQLRSPGLDVLRWFSFTDRSDIRLSFHCWALLMAETGRATSLYLTFAGEFLSELALVAAEIR